MVFDPMPLLKIAPIFLIALASPGPDFFLVSSLAMKRGRNVGLAAAAGIGTGNMGYACLSLFGLSYILSRMAWLIVAVKIIGGLYLLYLGYQLLKSGFGPQQSVSDKASIPAKKKNPYIMGLATNITNPKALAFFTSIFALVLGGDLHYVTQAAIITQIGVMSFVWFGFVTLVLCTPHMRQLYIKSANWIDRIAGVCLAGFGLKILASARN